MIIKFLLISLSFLSLSPILIVLGLCLTPTKKKKKRERDKIINILENKISNFENKQSSFLEKKVQLFLCHSLIKKNWYKISQFKDAIDLIYLRIYINMALNKVLNDTNLRKLIKSEIFKAPRGTFKEFLRLYNDLKKEFKTLFEVK
jgi:hypothetical protein